jgi:polar amino acid transport system substrate-binding protein
MKYVKIILFVLLFTLISVSYGESLPDKITLPADINNSGKIKVANKPNYPPLEYKDPETHKLLGIDIDIGEAIGDILGVEIDWQDQSFEQMIVSVKTGRSDLILSGMQDQKKRRKVLDMVDYMKSAVQFYTLKKNAEKFKKPTDFCGKSVGMSRTTKFPKTVSEWSEEHCAAANKPNVKIVGTHGSSDARSQLLQGRVVAAVQGYETLPYIMKQDPNTFVLVGDPIKYFKNAIGVSKNNTELRDAVVFALQKLMSNGKYQKIMKKYNLENMALSEVTVNDKPIK